MKRSPLYPIMCLITAWSFHHVSAHLTAQTTLVLQPDSASGKDARLFSVSNINRGFYPELPVAAWTWNGVPGFDRSVLAFDLSSVPAASRVTRAVLTLSWAPGLPSAIHESRGGPNAWLIQRVIEPWDEMTVTYSSSPASTTLHQVTAGPSVSENQQFAIDVTELVQDMVDDPLRSFGFMMRLPTEIFDRNVWPIGYRKVVFASSDYPDPTSRPKLEITYDPKNASVTLGMLCPDSARYHPGERVTIAVSLLSMSDSARVAARFRARIRYDAAVLFPLFATDSIAIEGDMRAAVIAGTRDPAVSPLVFELPFLVMLGERSCATVTIDSISWEGGHVETSIRSTTCEICADVCEQGGTRLYFSDTGLELLGNRPNPFNATTLIEYRIPGPGHVRISVVDMLGRSVASLVDEVVLSGKHSVRFDAAPLPSGSYCVVMETRNGTRLRMLSVLK